MLIKNNNEEILNKYIDYLKDKGKIVKIKDTKKEINIKFDKGIVYYFLFIVSILLVILTSYLFCNIFNGYGIKIINNLIQAVGVALFTLIVIGTTIIEKEHRKINITYPNEKQIKVNNKIFDIEKEECYIDILKYFTNCLDYDIHGYHMVEYVLKIRGNRTSKNFKILSGTEQQFEEFIYNFEYEISDFKNEKTEFLKCAQNILEQVYDKGEVSKDSLDKFNKYKNINE